MKSSIYAIVTLFVFAIASPALAVTLDVTITCDNAYGFGFGPASEMTTFYGGIRNAVSASDVSGYAADYFTNHTVNSDYTLSGYVGAEKYQINEPNPSEYIYVVAWCDNSTTEGLLAGFQFQQPLGNLLTGNDNWQVYATGIKKNSDNVDDTLTVAKLADINIEINKANNNLGDNQTTSIGWIDKSGYLQDGITLGRGTLAVGSKNDHVGALSPTLWSAQVITTAISTDAKWMWYNSNGPNNNCFGTVPGKKVQSPHSAGFV